MLGITLSINGTVSLQPFLSLSLATSIDFSIPEFDIDISENDIQISTSSINRFNASHVSIPLNIQFTNKFPVNIQVDMKIVLTSTPINQAMSNYGETVFNIDLDSDEMLIKNIEIETANEIVSSGKYSFDVIFSIDTDLRILNISDSVEKILGYKAEEFNISPVFVFPQVTTSEAKNGFLLIEIFKTLFNHKIWPPGNGWPFIIYQGQ